MVPLLRDPRKNQLMGFGAGCQNVLLGHVNYFELKTIMAQQTEEGLFTSPLTA